MALAPASCKEAWLQAPATRHWLCSTFLEDSKNLEHLNLLMDQNCMKIFVDRYKLFNVYTHNPKSINKDP